ncbi:hypothetical protein BGZ58_001364, partial [Dissophora ornata]
MAGSPTSSARASKVLSFPAGTFHIQSGIAGLVLDIETGFLKDPLKAGARVELTHKKSIKNSAESLPQLEQQLWKAEEGYIVNVRTNHVLDIQGGKSNHIFIFLCVVRAGSRVIQSVRKTGKDAAGQHWLNDDGVLTLASNPKFVIAIDGDATRDGTRITIQEKKAYNDKQKWYYPTGGDSQPASPSPSRAESISIRPDNFPTSWFYIKSVSSGLVVDIEHGLFTDPMKAGARAEMNHQKIDNNDGRHSLLELQLWRYDAGFLINRRTGFVLDIQGGNAPSNSLQELSNGSARLAGQDARNQHWFLENGFIANVYNSRLVLDIDGDGTKDGAKIAIGERKATLNADQQWILEEVRYQWLSSPGAPVIEEVIEREITSDLPAATIVLPTTGWFYIKSLSSGHVIDIEQGLLSDPMAPNVLASMNAQITSGDHTKIESQLWSYNGGQLINKRSGLVLDCKQGVVRYGARLMQGTPKEGKESHHQRWESVNGTLIIQGKPTFAIDIEGDGTKAGARLSLQRPKALNNLDQQWEFQSANFDWLQDGHTVSTTTTTTTTTKTTTSSKVVAITKDDWFFIKSNATELVMDLEAGWITSPTDVGAYISMKKQRSLDDADEGLLHRQMWRYEEGYFINRKTGFVIDIYGRTAVVGVKLIQQHQAFTEEDGKHNQLWTCVEGKIQSVHHSSLIISVESSKDGSRVQLVEHKPASQSSVNTWTLELAQLSVSQEETLEEANVSVHVDFPSQRWFYIKSKASSLVLDVEHGFFRDHTKPGTCLELNSQKLYASSKKHALLELQLWRFEDGFIINRRNGLVLDVAEGSIKAGARLIQWSRKSEGNANQRWTSSHGFIHLKGYPNLVLDVDGDGTRDGARISLHERKDKKNQDQKWSFESVNFTWLTVERSISENDNELLKEYETSNLARVIKHKTAPADCWFYLNSGISDLVLEVEHSRQILHMKSGTPVQLGHQKLKSGKHSHARLELQLWRFVNGHIINRRSGLALAVDSIKNNAKLIQVDQSNAETQRWIIEDGVIRLASRKDFAIFLSYGYQGSHAFIRQVRHGETVHSWSFAEVHFSWLTLDRVDIEQVEDEQLDIVEESDVVYLNKEKALIRRLEKFSEVTYFFLRTANGSVIDIEHGRNKNHMKVGAYASVHPQTTAASANQHALLDIQLWTLKDGYLINKRTGLALTFEGEAKDGARLIQALPKNSIKWVYEGGYIFPEEHSHLALNIREGYVVLVQRTKSTTWSIYEVTLSWLVFTEVILLEEEGPEDLCFYEEFEEIVMRSSAGPSEIIEYAKTEQYLVAPKECWFYLVAGNKVASVSASHLLERDAEGAAIELVVQKKFSSAERHALVELQLWKLEGSYIINRFTGHYLTVDSNGSLILATKQADASRQQWQFSEDGSLALISNSSQVVDFVNDKAVLVDRSASQTIWLYDAVQFTWLNTMENSSTYDVSLIDRELTEYRTVYTRYIQYITKYTIKTTVTTITRVRRIVRVYSQVPLEDATVVERDGTVWACHLVEAGTGVNYVMQLLHDNTKNVYYIYVQWGSTDGQLEGPYDSIEVATREFQDLFQSKTEIEWSDRDTATASGENWTTVDFEYDTITTEGERSIPGDESELKTTIIEKTSDQPLVDQFLPIAGQLEIYKDSEIYHTQLTQRSTGIIYLTQLLYNRETKTYYVYLRWNETDYVLGGPYETVEIAKDQFKTKYNETFGVTWETRDIATNNEWEIVYQTFDTTEEYADYQSESEPETETQTVKGGDTVTVIHTVAQPTVSKTTYTTVTVSEPTTSQKTSWTRNLAAGAGVAAMGVLTQIDGIWKRKSQVVTTRKAPVDLVCPIAKTSNVYYDEDVYDSVLTDKATGVTYVTQLIFDSKDQVYYVYTRWGETDYKLDGPHKTIEEAKQVYTITYHNNFGIEWKDREVAPSEKWSYEFKTYETYETTDDVEVILDENEVAEIIERENKVAVITTAQPAVTEQTSWFRKIASGAGAAATGVLTKVDGVWKRTVQVITTRKGHVDEKSPIAKTSYVYYDEDVYDAVVVDRNTGAKHVTQLVYDTETKAYYIYYSWSETDYKLDGPHKTIESAKDAFKVTYKNNFDIDWTERETANSDRFKYEIQTYETIEVVEEVEEDVDDKEAEVILAREKDVAVSEETTATTTTTTTTVTTEDVAVTTEDVKVVEEVNFEESQPDILVKQEEVTIRNDVVVVPVVVSETTAPK